MLLALDVGNTNTVFGIHDGNSWVGQWRIRTEREATEDEWAVRLAGLLELDGLALDQVDSMALASGVPRTTSTLINLGRGRLGVEPLQVRAEVAGMALGYTSPQTLGADRIANAVAAFEMFKGAALVVDFGTATNFEYISPKGVFEGGIIAPGLMITGEALFARTAQLPHIDFLKEVPSMVARDTASAMTVGLFAGYIALVEGLIAKLKAEVGTEPVVVATGGLAGVVAAHCPALERVEPNLTLDGVRLILERQRGQK